METQTLNDICEYRKGKVPVSDLTVKNYISTENLLPNKGGLVDATSLPAAETTQVVYTDDVLVSNIRPYFKKIWQAREEGGCSNDVLVFVAKPGTDPTFLYYVLANDKFFDYSTASSKGTKMPRGDKSAIMQYEVPKMALDDQIKIAQMLRNIDDKIETNEAINRNLLEQLNALYSELSTRKEWKYVAIGDLAEKIAMGPFGSNIKVSTFVDTGIPIISGNHLRGYFLEEPSYNYITEEHAEKLKNSNVYPKDVIFTHAGNIGQVAMIPNDCEYERYVISQRQFYLRCDTKKVLPEYVTLFFHSNEGQHDLLSYANQVGVPSIAQPATNLKKIQLSLPPINIQREWLETVEPMIDLYQKTSKENKRLADLRDSLLPNLMSGELDVSDLDI